MKSILILVLILIMGFKLTGQNAHYNYSKSSVTGTEYVGGLIGYSPADTAAITNSYARGSVEGSRYVGGFIGANNGMILNSYSTGQVGGLGDLGGFAGQNSGNIEFSYWDINSSGISFSDGGEGRSTENMTYPEYMETFIGWDFDAIWSHDLLAENDGYPLLKPVEVNRIQTRVFPPNVAVSSGDGFYPKNSEVVVSVQGSADYVFLGWFENGELLNNSLSFTYQVDGHATLVARFRVRNNHQLTLEALPNTAGTVLGEGTYLEGEEVEIIAIPAENHRFVHWQNEDGDAVSTDSVYLFSMPASDLLLFALFQKEDPAEYTLNLVSIPELGGSVIGAGDYPEGYEVTIIATPQDGFRFAHWMDADQEVLSADSVYSFNMPASDLILYALFEEVTSVSDLFDYMVLIYPNPATDYLFLEFHQIHNKVEVAVFNLQGQLLNQKRVYNTQKTDLNLPYPDGIYLISIRLNDELILEHKVLISR